MKWKPFIICKLCVVFLHLFVMTHCTCWLLKSLCVVDRCSFVLLHLQENSITAVWPTLLSNQRLDYCWVWKETLAATAEFRLSVCWLCTVWLTNLSVLVIWQNSKLHAPVQILFYFSIHLQTEMFYNSFSSKVNYNLFFVWTCVCYLKFKVVANFYGAWSWCILKSQHVLVIVLVGYCMLLTDSMVIHCHWFCVSFYMLPIIAILFNCPFFKMTTGRTTTTTTI